MLQCEPARHDSTARSRDLWTQSCEHLCFTESPLCFSCCLTPDTPLVTPGPIPPGQWILAPCGQLISTFWDSAGPIGIFMLGSDSPSACCFCSQWYWRGSSAAFHRSLWRACAALPGRSRFALPPSRFWTGNDLASQGVTLYSTLPVPRLPLTVRHGNNNDFVGVVEVDHREGKPLEHKTPCAIQMRRPAPRGFGDATHHIIDCGAELARDSRVALPIPSGAVPQIHSGFRMEAERLTCHWGNPQQAPEGPVPLVSTSPSPNESHPPCFLSHRPRLLPPLPRPALRPGCPLTDQSETRAPEG